MSKTPAEIAASLDPGESSVLIRIHKVSISITRQGLAPEDQLASDRLKNLSLIRIYASGFAALVARCEPIYAGSCETGLALTDLGQAVAEELQKNPPRRSELNEAFRLAKDPSARDLAVPNVRTA